MFFLVLVTQREKKHDKQHEIAMPNTHPNMNVTQRDHIPPLTLVTLRGLPFSTYAPRVWGGGQVSYTFPSRITSKKGRRGVQIACKIVYVLNGRPLMRNLRLVLGPRGYLETKMLVSVTQIDCDGGLSQPEAPTQMGSLSGGI